MDSFLKFLKQYMWVTVLVVIAFVVLGWLFMKPAKAQSVDSRFDRTKCYSWEGGHKSAGSFSQCDAAIIVQVVPVPGKEIVRETVRVERVEVPVPMYKEAPKPPKKPKKPLG